MWVFWKKSTILYLCVVVVSGLAGAASMVVCQTGCGFLGGALSIDNLAKHADMLQHTEYIVWLFLFTLTNVLAALFAFPLWNSISQFRAYLTRKRALDLAVSLVIVLLLFAIPDGILRSALGVETLPIYGFTRRVLLVLLVDFACIAPALAGIWLIRDVMEEKYRQFEVEGSPDCALEFLSTHLQLRELSQQYLWVFGLYIGIVTLTSGANRNLRVAANLDPGQVTNLIILTYALYFTVIIAVLYLPTFLYLVNTGRKFTEKFYPLTRPEDFVDVMAKRKAMEDRLQLNINLEQSLRTGLVILSPLISGLLSYLVAK